MPTKQAVNADVETRMQDAETFFKILHPQKVSGEIEFRNQFIHLAWKNPGFDTLGSYKTIEKVLAIVKKKIDKDLYALVCLSNGKSRDSENSTYAPGFFLEIDTKNLKTPEQIHTIHEELGKFVPGLVVNSGNGIHCYLLFNEPLKLTEESSQTFVLYNDRLRNCVQTIIKPYLKDGKNLDSIQDAARVLRIPGTVNNKDPKNPKPVKLIYHNDEYRHSFDDMCQLIDMQCDELNVKTIKPHTGSTATLNGNDIHLQAGLTLSPELFNSVKTKNKDFETTFNGNRNSKFKSASEKDQALANFCRMCGLNPQEILCCVIQSRELLNEDLHLNNPGKYIRTIERAFTDLEPWKANANPNYTPDEIKFIKKCFDNGQEGDADLYFKLNKDKFRYDNKNVKGNKTRLWFAWNGHKWESDDRKYMNAVSLLIPQYKTYIFHTIKEIKKLDPEANKQEIKDLKKLIENINKRINSIKRVNVKKDIVANSIIRHAGFMQTEWDNNINRLPFMNGVYDLETFTFEESKRENYNQMIMPYDYNPAATCPIFDKLINDQFGESANLILNAGEPLTDEQKFNTRKMKDYFQILNSLCLSGDNEQQTWVINWGPRGRNGKSKIYEALLIALGDYASPMADRSIMRTKYDTSHTDDLQALRGIRLAINSDTKGELDTSKVCKITGGDSYLGRGLFESGSHQKPPACVMYLQVNKRPKADANADYFWERTQLVKWNHRFLNNPEPGNPYERQRDVTIGNKVNAEYQGIINYLIEGWKKYIEAGRKIIQPESVKKDIEEYKFSSDGLKEFYKYYVVPSSGAIFSTKDAHDIYLQFAEEINLSQPIRSSVVFTKQMVDRFKIEKTQPDRKIKPTLGATARLLPEDEHGNKIDNRCPCFLEVDFSPTY